MHLLMIFSGLVFFLLAILPLAYARPGIVYYGAGLSGLVAVLTGTLMTPEPGPPWVGNDALVVLTGLLLLSGVFMAVLWFFSARGCILRTRQAGALGQGSVGKTAPAEQTREPLVSLAGFEPRWAHREMIASFVEKAERGLALERERLDGKPYFVTLVKDTTDWDGGWTSVEALAGFATLPDALAWAERELSARLAAVLRQPGYQDDAWVEVTDGPTPYIDELPAGSGHLKRLYRQAALRILHERQVFFADVLEAPAEAPYTPALFDYGRINQEKQWVSTFEYRWAHYFASRVEDDTPPAGPAGA